MIGNLDIISIHFFLGVIALAVIISAILSLHDLVLEQIEVINNMREELDHLKSAEEKQAKLLATYNDEIDNLWEYVSREVDDGK